jgi:general secretion pathway protein L
MSQQLILAINNSADNFRWCWMQDGQPQSSASGNLESLRTAVSGMAQQAWLLLPGSKVVTRELEYSEKEKKHLRNLLPFQLEDSVVGDIDDLHFALGDANQGKVAVSYTDKQWLREIFEQLTSIGIEVSRCWSAPTLLPFQSPFSATQEHAREPKLGDAKDSAALLESPATVTWVVSMQEGTVNLRFGEQQGFTLPKSHFAVALTLLTSAQGLNENLPHLVLRAGSEAQLKILLSLLPNNLAARVVARVVANEWQLDYEGRAIDLCQTDFSQRLPVERWLKQWRSVGIFGLVTLVIYLGVLFFNIHKLNKENLAIRQQTEAAFRKAIPSGPADDPEKKLRIKLAALEPKTQSGSVLTLLAGVLPMIASNSDISVKTISYSSETGEININIQSHSFNSIDTLQKSIESQGFKVELLTANAQGDVNTARLKISKP